MGWTHSQNERRAITENIRDRETRMLQNDEDHFRMISLAVDGLTPTNGKREKEQYVSHLSLKHPDHFWGTQTEEECLHTWLHSADRSRHSYAIVVTHVQNHILLVASPTVYMTLYNIQNLDNETGICTIQKTTI